MYVCYSLLARSGYHGAGVPQFGEATKNPFS